MGSCACKHVGSTLTQAWQRVKCQREWCNVLVFACSEFLPAGTSGPQADTNFALSDLVYTAAVIFLTYIHSIALLLSCRSTICVEVIDVLLQREMTHFARVCVHTWIVCSDWECFKGCRSRMVCSRRTVAAISEESSCLMEQ